MDNINNILTYDIFIFDFDGIIIDSEKIHNKCWNIILEKYNINFNYNDYCKTFHTNINDGIRKTLKNDFKIDNFDILCDEKNKLYHEYIMNNNIDLIDGIELFLNFLRLNNKKIIIATNTNKNNVDYIFSKVLKTITIDDIISRELIKNKKPNPEIYNIIFNKYDNNNKYVIFEDSLSGITSVCTSLLNNNLNKIFFLNDKNYYHYDFILNNYNIIHIPYYDINNISNKLS